MSGIEIVGIAASVLQLADLGGRLSVALFTFSRKIKNADKSIASISAEIAQTGSILQQLGNELQKDSQLRLCSADAVATAKALVNDCYSVFDELKESLDAKVPKNKIIAAWKQKLTFPLIEPQIDLLRTNLERLKSSLLVMLNVLIFAEQLRNQESLPILKDQRELVRTLLEDKNGSEAKLQRILRAVENPKAADAGAPCPNSNPISLAASTVPSDTSATSIRDNSPLPTVTTPQLPSTLKAREEEIRHQCALLRKVVDEIGFGHYKVDHGLRDRMHRGVLGAHWDGWYPLRKLYGDSVLLEAFSEVPAVTQYWISKFEAEAVEAIYSSDSEAALETSSEFEGLEEASENGPFNWNPPRSKFQSEFDAECDDVGPHEEYHLYLETLNKKDSAANPLLRRLQGCDVCRRREVQCDLGDIHPHCLIVLKILLVRGEECTFPTTWRKASSTTGNLASVEQVTLLPGNHWKLDEVASTEMVGLRKQKYNKKKLANSRPTCIKVHKKYLLPETLNAYQLPWSYEKNTNYIIIEKYISHELQDELFAHTKKIQHRKLIEPSIERKVNLEINQGKKDKMHPVRGALSTSRLSPVAQNVQQQLLHEEEIDEWQSASMLPQRWSQRQRRCSSTSPAYIKYGGLGFAGPSIVPESSFDAAWKERVAYETRKALEAVDDLSRAEMKSSVRRESIQRDIADISKGKDEVDELLAQWTTLAPSEFSQHDV